jgi:hypothetical protein
MKALLNIMLSCLVFFSSLAALYPQSENQIVPPTYWENYMSFKIGNYFEYEVNRGLYRYSRKIVGDTIVLSNGNQYCKIRQRMFINSKPYYLFQRIDSN